MANHGALADQARQAGECRIAVEQQRQVRQRLLMVTPRITGGLHRQPEDLAVAEDVLEVQRGQIVELAVGRQRQQVADAGQPQVLGGVLRQRVAVVGRDVGHPRLLDGVPVVVA